MRTGRWPRAGFAAGTSCDSRRGTDLAGQEGGIRLETSDGVAVLTIDAPHRNALTRELAEELSRACDEVDADPVVGAAVIRGAGGTFCSGADRSAWVVGADQAEDGTYRMYGAIYAAFRRVGALAVPTIAAVRGAAVGAGLNLALAADLRVVAEDARLLAGFLRIGLHPGGGFFTLAHRSGGREATAALGLFSEEVSGRRAVELGIAWEALPDADVEDRAFALAARAAADPELARQALRSFREEAGPPGMTWDAAIHFERATQMWSQRRRDEA